jgi:hypothetical protein
VAVQVAPALNPVTVTINGAASVAEPEDGEGVPLVQVTFTVTLAPLFGTKSLEIVNVPDLSVLVIVHEPAVSAAEHDPVDSYPDGIGDSVAVHVGLPR